MRGFMSSMTQRTTFQLIKLLFLTIERRRSRHLKVLFVLIMRLTKTSPPSQKELLQWHFRLGHIGFQHVQWLIRTGRMKVQGNPKAVANCERTKCAACEFEKGHRRPNKINTINNNPMKEQELNKYHLLPGQMVSADHYISRSPGRLYHTKGILYQSDMFSGGCVFIEHASEYVSIKHQVAIDATENVKAKLNL